MKKQIVVTIALMIVVLSIFSCSQEKNEVKIPNVKGMNIKGICDLYNHADSLFRVKIIDQYLDSIKRNVNVTEVSVYDITDMYKCIHNDYFPSDKNNLVRIKNFIIDNYKKVFDSFGAEGKIGYLVYWDRIVVLSHSEISPILDDYENMVKKTDSISKLPSHKSLVYLLSVGGAYEDTVLLEKIRKTGSSFVLQKLVPKLIKANTLIELDSFKDLNDFHSWDDFFFKEIGQVYDAKLQLVKSIIEKNPQNYSFTVLKDYLERFGRDEEFSPQFLAATAKKATTYDECMFLMENYVEKDTPVYSYLNQKAQKLLGL